MVEVICLVMAYTVQITFSSMQLIKLLLSFNADATGYTRPKASLLPSDFHSIQILTPTLNTKGCHDSFLLLLRRLPPLGPWLAALPRQCCDLLTSSSVLGLMLQAFNFILGPWAPTELNDFMHLSPFNLGDSIEPIHFLYYFVLYLV